MLNSPLVDDLIRLAITEDLSFGDVTTSLTIPASSRATATIVAREELVVCGQEIVPRIFRALGWEADTTSVIPDGEKAGAETVITRISGATRHLISAERTILNFMQRMSGVATHCRKLVDASHGITILDTRKTMPGWRILEKYAVSVGGARNHRFNLGDMILVKNNHVDAAGGNIRTVLARIRDEKPFYMPVEVEVRDFAELEAALEFDPEVVMLDNMSNEEISRALEMVEKAGSRSRIEISGGITVERLPSLAAIGVRHVSIGGLTTRATNVDISMRVQRGQA